MIYNTNNLKKWQKNGFQWWWTLQIKFRLCPGVTVEERVDVYDIMFKQENGEYERYSFEFGPKL